MIPPNISGVDNGMPNGTVSLYNQNDALDEFPVLKAFQEYIAAEQAKARKNMIMLSVCFAFLLAGVIAVFIVLMISVNSRHMTENAQLAQRNQVLNDRLVEYAMKDRDKPAQDSSGLKDVTACIASLQKQVAESQSQAAAAEERAKKLEATVSQFKGPTGESPEVAQLRALLQAEKDKVAAEREKNRQAELEAYRREHYPELYAPKKTSPERRPSAYSSRKKMRKPILDEVDDVLSDDDAITYFDEEDVKAPAKPVAKPQKSAPRSESVPAEPQKIKPKPKSVPEAEVAPETPDTKEQAAMPEKPLSPPAAAQAKPAETEQASENKVQLNIQGKTSSWNLPNE